METTSRHEAMAAPPSARVWDLAEPSNRRTVRRRGFTVGGPIAAVLGGVAIGSAVAPDLPVEARWSLVASTGILALLVGCSAVRRRQALLSLLLAVAGLLLPLAAGAMAVDTTMAAKPAVTSDVVPDAALGIAADALVPSPTFSALSTSRRVEAEAFATALVLRLRTLHGSSGPYPASLRLSSGSVVEAAGVLRGTALGVVPNDARLVYRVGRSGSAFEVVVLADHDETASITATNALSVAGAD